MYFRSLGWAGVFAVFALGALAHSGVKNPAVMARMEAMSAVGDAMKVLGDMAKGKTAFDAAKAEDALKALQIEAEAIPALFEAREDDPKSEALPSIWEDYEDFSAQAQAMGAAAAAARGQLSTQDDVGLALQGLGQTCKGCHKTYRK